MLSVFVDAPARWLLYGLWALWAALLVVGCAFGTFDPVRQRRLPLPARMGTSIVLVIAAFVWWRAGTADTALASYGLFIFLGMAFGFLGDLFMARLLVSAPKNVIFGILAFGVGHVFYILAFRQAGRVLGLDTGLVWLWAVVIYLAAAAVLWFLMVRSPAKGAALNAGTLVYSLLLSAMAGLALALAVQNPSFWPLALGGVLFIVSDLILGSEIMRGTTFRSIGDVIWITYTVAQMLIVYSSSVALQSLAQMQRT